MSYPSRCDVVVVGGGPAGSTAATMLARSGHHVVLFERQKHPRNAVGESLIPDFWKYTDLTGASAKIEAEGFVQKAGGIMNWNGQHRTHSFRDFGYDRPALHVERDRFDHILLAHAREQGVEVHEQAQVTQTRFTDEGAEVEVRAGRHDEAAPVRCRYVLDASGQSAVIGWQLGVRVVDEAFRYLSVWGYFEPARYLDGDGHAQPHENVHRISPTTYVTSLQEYGEVGWAWYIVLREKVSVGLVFPLESTATVKEAGEGWERWVPRKCAQIPVIDRLLDGAGLLPGSVRGIRDYSYRSRQVAGPGYFLLGDAAGFVDPIFSVGVVLAFYSAYAASWAVDRCLQKPKRAAEYQALYTRQLEGRLEIARSMALPRYSAEGQVSRRAQQALQLERRGVQELMHAATSLIERSDNVLDMMGPQAGAPGADRVRCLERLVL